MLRKVRIYGCCIQSCRKNTVKLFVHEDYAVTFTQVVRDETPTLTLLLCSTLRAGPTDHVAGRINFYSDSATSLGSQL